MLLFITFVSFCRCLKHTTADLRVPLSDDDPSPFSNNHLNEKFTEANKTIGFIRKLFCFLPRYTLLNTTNYILVLVVITIISFKASLETALI